MIEVEKLCRGCMHLMNPLQRICPMCGYDNEKEEKRSNRCLPEHTILKGKYLLGRVLGEGGFGITYIALDLQKEQTVAIKEFFPVGLVSRNGQGTGKKAETVLIMPGEAGLHYREGLRKFAQESRTLTHVRELPGIVTARDFFFENETAYLVMDYIAGQSLKEYMDWYRQNNRNGSPMDYQVAVALLLPIMDSLVQIHKQGLIHRDISPDNIIVDVNGCVTLIDFGAARTSITDNEYRSMTIMVKHGYAPEEQYRTHGKQGPWTDIYAICATLYHMISGRLPEDSIERLVQDNLVPLKNIELPVKVPAAVSDVLEKGMEVHAVNRYQTMEELQKALNEAVTEQELIEKRQKEEKLEREKKFAEEQMAEKKRIEEARLEEKKRLEKARRCDEDQTAALNEKEKKKQECTAAKGKKRVQKKEWKRINTRWGVGIGAVFLAVAVLVAVVLMQQEDRQDLYFLPDSQMEELNQSLWESAKTEEWERLLKENEIDVSGIDGDDIVKAVGSIWAETYTEALGTSKESDRTADERKEKAPYWDEGKMAYLKSDGCSEAARDYVGVFSKYGMKTQERDDSYRQTGFYVPELLEADGTDSGLRRSVSSENGYIGVQTEDGLQVFSYKGKIGYVDLQGDIVIPPRFSAASEFCEGRALVRLESETETGYTFINKKGDIVTPVFEDAADYSNGLARVLFEDEGITYAGYMNLEGDLEYVLSKDKLSFIEPGDGEISIEQMGIPAPDGTICVGINRQVWENGKGKAEGGYLLLNSKGKLLKEYSSDYRISSFLPCGMALVQDVSELNEWLKETDSKKAYKAEVGEACQTEMWYIGSNGNTVGNKFSMSVLTAAAFLNKAYGDSWESMLMPSAESVQEFLDADGAPRLLSPEETEKLNRKLWEQTDIGELEANLYENSVDLGNTLAGVSVSEESTEDDNTENAGSPEIKVPYLQNGQEAFLYPDGTVARTEDGFTGMSVYEEYGWRISLWYYYKGVYSSVSPAGYSYQITNNDSGVQMLEQEENGLFCIGAKGKIGYTDANGTILIPPTFYGVQSFSEGLAAVMIEIEEWPYRKCTFIDTEGHIIAPLIDSARSFENGYAAVSFFIDGQQYEGLMDQNGNLKYVFENVSGFHAISFAKEAGTICVGGSASYWDLNTEVGQKSFGRYYIFDLEGNILKEFDSDYRIGAFMPCGLAMVQDVSEANRLWQEAESVAEYCRELSRTETKLWYMDSLGNQVGENMEMTMEEAEQFLNNISLGDIFECSSARRYTEPLIRKQSTTEKDTAAADEGEVRFSGGVSLVAGENLMAAICFDSTVTAIGNQNFDQEAVTGWYDIESIASNNNEIAGLKKDGTVVLTGDDIDVSDWSSIVEIAYGNAFVAGLKEDGTVRISEISWASNVFGSDEVFDGEKMQSIAAGGEIIAGVTEDKTVKLVSTEGDRSSVVSDWTDIISVSVGSSVIVGLRENGTAVAASISESGTEEYDLDDWDDLTSVAVGENHIVGLKSDGTVLCTGKNGYGECNTQEWKDVAEIAAGRNCTAGIKKDGTLLFAGKRINAAGDVADWRNIVDISAGNEYSVGLKEDGTVTYAGNAPEIFDEMREWRNIESVETGYFVTAGLKEDGTVVAAGNSLQEKVADWTDIKKLSVGNDIAGVKHTGMVLDTDSAEERDISGWEGVISISVAYSHKVGLKAGGSVIAVGDNDKGQCEVSEWTDIVDIAAAGDYTAGLRSDGTVVFTGESNWGAFSLKEWTNIDKLYADEDYLIGLKTDGTIVLAGRQYSNGIDLEAVRNWEDIQDIAVCDAWNEPCILGLQRDGTVVAERVGGSSTQAIEEWSGLRVREGSMQ